MRIWGYIRLPALLAGFAGVLILSWLGPRECGLYGDKGKCVSTPATVTRVRIDEYYCRLEAFRRTCGVYPTTEQGLTQLIEAHSCEGALTTFIMGIREIPGDGFGQGFAYRSEGDGFSLVSYGKDGKAGGNGENSDKGMRISRPPVSFFNGRVLVWGGFNLCL